MITLEEKKRIRYELPHGSCNEIARLAGVSRIAVSQWFNTDRQSYVIEDVTLSLYGNYKKAHEKRMKSLGLR